MLRKFLLPSLAMTGFLFAVWMVVRGSAPIVAAQPVADPSTAPYAQFVAGAGLIEASSENIAVGAPVAGVVMQVAVVAGSAVTQGDLLFALDDRSLRAQLAWQQAQLAVAKARLKRLEGKPHPDSVPAAVARLTDAEVSLSLAQDQMKRLERADKRTVTDGEMDNARLAVLAASAKLNVAKAELATWQADIEVSKAEIVQAEATVHATVVELQRLEVRAPVSGEVLQVKVRVGEFAPAGALNTPLMTLGNVAKLHVRADIDENDAWRISKNASAYAFARGNNQFKVQLKLERIEPLVVPKRSLTGESTERVDTRVLQVVFSFERGQLPLYVGQQMDVFIEVLSGK